MPELPEVETVRRGLLGLVGKRILSIELNRADLRFPFPEDMDSIAGRKIIDIERRAKYLLIRLEDDLTWLAHLGMTGRFGQTLEGKHDHVIVDFVDGSRLVYTDPRRFGIMDLIRGNNEHKLLSHLGPEPLGDDWSGEILYESLRGRNVNIKTALLDQKVVVGIGNIYASEILFRAGISPKRLAKNISKNKSMEIYNETQHVLLLAIEAGGSTLRDGQFKGIDGDLGYFPHEFAVYDREGEICTSPGCENVVKRMVQSGRSTFFCSRCQR
ncbi:MAG: bifunctional DNA-formamidopyrimidine glycosylase/DNA-(apurinic or apyrimidinic site) lyase [Candidatus Thermoplasmatota archaeon]|nr:bifunctional DNA-formamidopyrimidine glycosylase/DNA-(apurinic or apyrimidinic site) lyase [Candidatus Thermoplasmatota archaeon]